jgi:hypothetical protein
MSPKISRKCLKAARAGRATAKAEAQLSGSRLMKPARSAPPMAERTAATVAMNARKRGFIRPLKWSGAGGQGIGGERDSGD